MSEAMERALDWDDEIEQDGARREIVPEGDYDFEVVKFERGRHDGRGKIPSCPKAVLSLAVTNGTAKTSVTVSLFLHTVTEWKLCEFFTAIGLRRHGERLRMNWNSVVGARGRCRIGVRTWVSERDGKEHKANEIEAFLDPADAKPAFTPGVF